MNASDITDRLKRDIAKLSKSERRRAVESVRNAIRAMVLESESDELAPKCCPRCGSVAFVRKGRDVQGGQRHLCRDCGRTFGPETGHVVSSSKLAPETWMAYAECTVARQMADETCADRVSDLFNVEPPYMDYWRPGVA